MKNQIIARNCSPMKENIGPCDSNHSTNMTVSMYVDGISNEELCLDIMNKNTSTLILDCRPFFAFGESRILNAINVHVPKLFRRRTKVPLKLENILNCKEARNKLANGLFDTVVVYDDIALNISERESGDDMSSILECLIQQPSSYLTTTIRFLSGGYKAFSQQCPELCQFCESTNTNSPVQFCLQPLQKCTTTMATPSYQQSPGLQQRKRPPPLCLPKLCIPSAVDNAPPITITEYLDKPCRRTVLSPLQDCCRSVPTRTDQPVSILPHLYLGNALHSECEETLRKLGVTAVLNVSKRCRNHFTKSLDYKKICVDDDTDADLSVWFTEATTFIDSVKEKGGRVFVHCKAGISRSATICLAYLMISQRMRLEEAFEYVHKRRAIISPNFAFMMQLQRLDSVLFCKSPTAVVTGIVKAEFSARRMARSVSLPGSCFPKLGLSPPGGIGKDSMARSTVCVNRHDRWSPGLFCTSPHQPRPVASPS